MIKVEDLKDMGYVDDQLDFWQYWEPQANPADAKPQEMVREFIKISGQEKDANLYLRLIHEEFSEWLEWAYCEFATVYRPKELKELADLVYVIYGYAEAMGYDLDKALWKVHDNNMGRMFQPDGTIKRREDGKIVKNESYPKVDLGDCI